MKKNKEVRALGGEMRAKPESRTIEGYAALYNQETDLGWFREIIMPGAFDGADLSDVRALFNHDPNSVLARTASGTLRLEVDERGLKYEFEAPNTSTGNDLLEMIRRGDVSQSSFAFTVEKSDWEEEEGRNDLRKITRFATLYDVSPVTYPAYAQTSVQARSLQEIKAEEHPEATPEPEKTDNNEQLRMMGERARQMRFSIIQQQVKQ